MVVRTRGLGSFAKVPQQSRSQYVLNQGGLARARHAGDAHQAPQRNFHRHVVQVVLAHAFKHQAWRVLEHQAFEPQAHLLAPAQISACEGIGIAQSLHGAIKHNLAAALTGSGAHVNHTVGGPHHRRVVLHHHQGVARIAQAVHGLDDALHILGMQAYAGFIQHK